jgi:hypothetical protein
MVAVGHPDEHPGLDEAGEALVEHVAGDPESLLEIVKAGHAQERVAEDQQRPPLAHDLQALGDRAVHIGEALAFHRRAG